MLVVTCNDLPGYRISHPVGIARGLTVRSRNAFANALGGLQSVFGGQNQAYTKLAEDARNEAYNLMVMHAQQMGANAIVAMRYDANEIMEGITEVIAYGTAVVAAEG